MKQKEKLPNILVMPVITIILFTVYIPIILTFAYSLNYYKLIDASNKRFIWFDNFKEILTSPEFYNNLINTGVVVGVVVILGVISSFITALILNKKNKISGILTGIAMIPWALPPIVNGIIWKFLFYPEIGFLNKLFNYLNIIDTPLLWLNTRFGSLIILGAIVAWRAIPFCSLLLLATLQSIPEEIYQVASIDGANGINKIKYITIPMLMPSLVIVVLNLILSGINLFDEAVSLVGYREMNETFMVYNYTHTFSFFNIGYGSAIIYVIMMISGVFGYSYIKFLKRGLKND